MEITTRQSYDVLIADLNGRLDSTTSGYGYDELVKIAQSGNKQVLLNLEKLEFVSSAGLRSLLVAAKLLQAAEGQLKLCQANPAVSNVLQTSGFNSLLSLYATEAEAIKSFK